MENISFLIQIGVHTTIAYLISDIFYLPITPSQLVEKLYAHHNVTAFILLIISSVVSTDQFFVFQKSGDQPALTEIKTVTISQKNSITGNLLFCPV